eukprot:m.152759 g.152759  ORF g.152759 m.152759 type:complete len:52 (+) comp38606_c0_seq12:1006-1161(+)
MQYSLELQSKMFAWNSFQQFEMALIRCEVQFYSKFEHFPKRFELMRADCKC